MADRRDAVDGALDLVERRWGRERVRWGLASGMAAPRSPRSIANEMAADLTADIEEAESEGGTAEDVVGNGAFDPRRFAGQWAIARGVTAPPAVSSPPRRWPALAFGLIGCAALLALGVAILAGGRQSAAAISSAGRNLGGPKSMCSLVSRRAPAPPALPGIIVRPSSFSSSVWRASVSPSCTWPPGTAPASALGRSADTVLDREPPGHDRPRLPNPCVSTAHTSRRVTELVFPGIRRSPADAEKHHSVGGHNGPASMSSS